MNKKICVFCSVDVEGMFCATCKDYKGVMPLDIAVKVYGLDIVRN
jgi:hypothetical protein